MQEEPFLAACGIIPMGLTTISSVIIWILYISFFVNDLHSRPIEDCQHFDELLGGAHPDRYRDPARREVVAAEKSTFQDLFIEYNRLVRILRKKNAVYSRLFLV